MKKILLIAAVLCAAMAQAQVSLPTNNDGLVEYAGVVNTGDSSTMHAQSNCVAWMEKNYKADRDRKIGDEGIMDIQRFKSDNWSGGVTYEIRVYFREGRYKYVINNFVHKDYDGKRCSGGKFEREEPSCARGTMSQKNWDNIKRDVDRQVKELVASLQEGMLVKEKIDNSDDW